MANNDATWALETLVRFGSLDAIITIDGRLERIQTPTHSGGASTVANTLQGLHLRRREQGVPAAPPRCSFDSVRLERQLQAFRGPHTTQDDLRCTIYSLANVAAQLAGGNPISPSVMAGYATTAFRFLIAPLFALWWPSIQRRLGVEPHPGAA